MDTNTSEQRKMLESIFSHLSSVVESLERNDLTAEQILEAKKAARKAKNMLTMGTIDPNTKLKVWDRSESLDTLCPADIQTYLKSRLPKDKDSFRGERPEVLNHRYLVVNPVHLIDRSSALGEAAWMDMVDHHLFPGHSSCNMVFEQFYSDHHNLSDLLSFALEDGSESALRPFEVLIVAWLNDNGYYYESRKLIGPDGTQYDGVLLDICW